MAERVNLSVAPDARDRVRVDIVDGDGWRRLREPGGGMGDAERAALQRLAAFSKFEGKAGQALPWSAGEGVAGLVLGRERAASPTQALRSAAAAAMQLLADGCRAALVAPSGGGGSEAAQAAVGALAEGLLLGGYRFRRSGKAEPERAPLDVAIVTDLPASAASRALERARAVVAAVTLARDLVNAPAAELGPEELAEAAVAVAKRHAFEVEVVRVSDVAARGFRM